MNLRPNGFTLVEMLVVIAIIAILAAIGVPNFQDFIRSNSVTTQTNDIIAGLTLARSEAIRQNRTVIFCRADAPTAPPVSCTTSATGNWQGWVVYADANSNGQAESTEIIKIGQVTNSSMQVLSSSNIGTAANTIVFRGDSLARDSNGNLMTAGSGTVRICIASSSNNNARDISLSGGGKTVVTSSTSASCAAPGN